MQVKSKTVSKDAAKTETPSEKIVREARPSHTVVDSLGRTIVYRRSSILDEAKLARNLGADLAGNYAYMRFVNIACAVQTIDGEYGTAPTRQSMIEVRIEWIGDEGYVAVWSDMLKQAQIAEDAAENAEDYKPEFDEKTGLSNEAQETKN